MLKAFHKQILLLLLLSAGGVPAYAGGVNSPSVLRTPSYIVTITSLCPEGDVDCDRIRYRGVNKRTGKSIRLMGSDWIRYCPDDQGDGPGKTPCQHLGYKFRNGKVTYYVSDDGELQVIRGRNKILLDEKGKWDDE